MTNPTTLISTPFANSGTKNTIPDSGASAPQLATMEAGFPTSTQTPINEGGIPPERADFNGLGYLTTSHLEFLNKGNWYEFDEAFAAKIGGYPINARLRLDNGDIVQSTIPNNSNNPNSNMSGWIKPSVSADSVIDESGLTQQQINSFSVTPQQFGAKGDGVFDDRPAFQAAIDYLRANGGGELSIPRPPVEYRWKSYDTANSACLVIDKPIRSIYVDPITIRGMGNLISIKVELPAGTLIEAAILLKNGGLYKKFENISVYGGLNYNSKNCKYVFKGVDTFYPNLTINNCQFYAATEYCFYVQTFVSVFSQLQTAYSKRGIVVEGFGNPQTSITLNSCYALNHDHYGYWFGETTYCTFNSCASDHIINNLGDGVEAYPYYIDIARGVTFNGCGAESSTRILHVRSAQGLTINGIDTLSIGDNTTPPNQLIRIDGGASTVISGLWNQNPKAFTYKLKLGNAISAESVTVLDQSIAPSEAQYVSNFRFENPIRFLLWDFSQKTQDNTLVNTGNAATNSSNLNALARLSDNTSLIHDNIIRLPSGDFEINSTILLCNAKTRGNGRIRLIGHADGTSRIVFSGNGGVSFGLPSQIWSVNFSIENLTLFASSAITAGQRGVLAYKANISMINGKIMSHNGFVQYAATRDSNFTLDVNSSIQTPAFSNGVVNFSYEATTPPATAMRLPVNTIFIASDPNQSRISWVNTANNGSSWLPVTVSEPTGTTAQRPTGVAIGYQYFDTTLGKPIFLKTLPAVWVDAAGATV